MMMPALLRRARSRRVAAATGLVSCLVLVGCGSGGSSDTVSAASSAETAACVATAQQHIAEWSTFPSTLPASPPARYTPLASPPPSKTIVYLAQNYPADAETGASVVRAAEVAGWRGSVVTYDSTVPDLVAKFDQVISQRPDFITLAGFPAASVKQQIDAAKAAGISVVMAATADQPVSVPGLAAVVNGSDTARLVAELNAYKMLADSGCTGNTAVFDLDYPIIKVGDDAYTAAVRQNCHSCKISVATIQAKDIGTPAATQQMVAQLQADPTVKYAYTVIGNLAGGLAQALRTAGLDNVRIFGQVPDESSIAALRNGTNAWWVNQASAVNGYDIVDAAIRVAASGTVQKDVGGYPFALLTPQNVPPGDQLPVIPANILDLYAATWKAR